MAISNTFKDDDSWGRNHSIVLTGKCGVGVVTVLRDGHCLLLFECCEGFYDLIKLEGGRMVEVKV